MEFNATFLVSAISFILFTLIMNTILYKPLSEILKKRQEYLDANENAANECLKGVNDISTERESKLTDSRNNAKNMILEEIENSKKSKSKEEATKKQEVVQKLSESKTKLAEEKERISSELENEAHDISDLILKKIVGEEAQNG